MEKLRRSEQNFEMEETANGVAGGLERFLLFPIFKVGDTEFTLLSLGKVIFWIALVLALNAIVQRVLIQRALKRTRLDVSLQYAVGKIFSYVFVTLGLYVALQVNGVNLSSLAVLAGAVGVGLGFGLQNIISNFVSGLIILAERPISIGDRIEINGVAGKVTNISMRSTTVVTNDNISIIVPNSDFVTNPITNWSHGDPRVQIRVPVGVAYGTDIAKLERVLLEVADAHPKVLKKPEPRVFFDAFGDSSLNFELGVWTVEMIHAPRRFRSELNFAIERKLRENNIEIPFPQRDLHLRSGHFILKKETEESEG